MAGSLYLGSQKVCPAVLIGGGQPYDGLPTYEVVDGVVQKRSSRLTGHEFDGIRVIDGVVFSEYYSALNISGDVVFRDLEEIKSDSMSYTFAYCEYLDGVVDFHSLKIIREMGMPWCFYKCPNIKSVYFTSLEKVEHQALRQTFAYCGSITDVYFNSLKTTSFDAGTNPFRGMMVYYGESVVRTLHFPSNLEPTIQALPGYPDFGGEPDYIVLAFDLPATE